MFGGGGDDDSYGNSYGADSNNYSGGGNFGGDSNNYSGGGNFGGDSNNYRGSVGFGGDSNNYSGGGAFGGDSNSYSNHFNSTQEREQETRTSRLADVETYSYSDSTLPLNSRNSQNTAEPPVVETQPRPEKDDTHPSPPSSAELGTNTNPYLEQDLAIHNSEDFPGAEDKITMIDEDSACPDSILASDLHNNRDNENNDGSLFHEMSALNHTGSEKQANSSETEGDSCGMDCLYFTLQCCECTIL